MMIMPNGEYKTGFDFEQWKKDRENEKPSSIKIEIPEGYVIDKENCDLEKGVIKFKEEVTYPKTWSEFTKLNKRVDNKKFTNLYFGDFVKNAGVIINVEERMFYKHMTLLQLDMLCKYYNGYWEPDDSDFNPKFNIVFDENGLSVVRTLNKHYLFCFQEESTAHIFLENFSTMLYSVKEYFVLD